MRGEVNRGREELNRLAKLLEIKLSKTNIKIGSL